MNTSAENQDSTQYSISWDKAFKAFFTNSVIVENLLSSFLDQSLVGQLDLTSLEPWKSEHVSDKFRERFNDSIWRVRMKTDNGETWLYCFIMIEFQRTVDRTMALRFNEYATMLIQELHNAKQASLAGDCSPVLPFLVSVAEQAWTAPTSIRAMRPQLSPLLDRYQPQMEYILIDAFSFDRDKAGNLLEILLATCNATPGQVAGLLDKLPDLLKKEEYGNLCRLFSEWINVAVMLPSGFRPIEPIDIMEDRKMFAARIQAWKDEVTDQIRHEVRDQIRNEVLDEFRMDDRKMYAARIQAWKDEVRDQIRDEVLDEVYNKVQVDTSVKIANKMLAAGEPKAKIIQFTQISEKQFDELQGR